MLKPQSVNKPYVPVISGNNSGKSERILPCEFCQNRHRGKCRIQSNLCYACGGDDHFIRDCPQNVQKVSSRPPANSSITPTVRNKDPRQTQNGNRGRGRGSHSNASTRQDSRAPARNYHLRGRECSDGIAGVHSN
ncbi:hypothetical protein V6N13_072369 [Hibiscus sabdariffa]